MSQAEKPVATNGAPIAAADIAEALTKAPFAYSDGSTQEFTPDGHTTYTENGNDSFGEWGVDAQGKFWSFWPPSYRAGYDLSWVTGTDGKVVGVRFAELGRGTTFEGRYQSKSA